MGSKKLGLEQHQKPIMSLAESLSKRHLVCPSKPGLPGFHLPGCLHTSASISLLPAIKFSMSHILPVFPWDKTEEKEHGRGDEYFLRKEQEMTSAL